MGSSLQRLEILLIGLVVLIAGAVVAVLMLVRPQSPTTFVAVTPQPITTSAAVRATSALSTSVPAQIPTAEPVQRATAVSATIASAAASALQATAESRPSAEPAHGIALPRLAVTPMVRMLSPWLLPVVGLVGCILVGLRLRRQRRMTYTNQNMGQLLAAADAATRADNIKIMQDLAAKGLLTAELAAAAGIDLAQPQQRRARLLPNPRLPRIRITLPRLALSRPTLPSQRLPLVRIPKLSLPRHPKGARRRPLSLDLTPPAPAPQPAITDGNSVGHAAPPTLSASESVPVAPLVNTASAVPAPAAPAPATPAPAHGLGVATVDEAPSSGLHETALRGVLAAQAIELPQVELDAPPATDDTADSWTAEDRALAVANVIAEIWAEEALHSPIVAIDTASTLGNGQVIVTVVQHPDEEDAIIDMPVRIAERRPTWRSTWRQDVLEVFVATDGAQPPIGGPLIAPILAHGRGGKTTRFYPLASWRHLGLYGGNALGVLHAALGSLLYAQPPSNLALAILDNGEITPLYRNVAHLVPLPSSPRETIELLVQAIRRGTQSAIRPLVLVVVEPDDTNLNLLLGIAARLAARPATPVHLVIVQERLRNAGRELYAMLPSLITGGGHGSAALLPGQGAWPRRGEARLVGRGMRVEGRAITLDEAAIAALVAELRGQPKHMLPVLWDAPAPPCETPAARTQRDDRRGDDRMIAGDDPLGDGAAPIEVDDRLGDAEPIEGDGGRLEDGECTAAGGDGDADQRTDDGAQRRRIAPAITAQRQRLMDAQDVPPVVPQPAITAQHTGVSDVAGATSAAEYPLHNRWLGGSRMGQRRCSFPNPLG